MAKVHILNVSPGDCTIIQHNSGRVTCIDICGGNLEVRQRAAALESRSATLLKAVATAEGHRGNFHMCERPSNPINYIKTFGIGKIFRLVVTHPDMDHMDGIDNLYREIGFSNFWDSGARRAAPSFEGFYRYKKEDWDLYTQLINKEISDVRIGRRMAGDRFKFANRSEDGEGSDGLHILAPNNDLLCDPNENDDINEASYVIRYNSAGGNMIFAGDAHDDSWEFVIKNNPNLRSNCSFLLAPHHGRHSGRDYDFLDFLQPKLTVIGCSPSKYIDYSQWHRRGLEILTSNQAGNIVLETFHGGYSIYVENENFAETCGGNSKITNGQGYYFYKSIYL